MYRKKIAQAAVSITCAAIGIALSKRIMHGASALATAAPTELYQLAPEGYGTFIYPSKVAATIFGADSTEFDYHLASDNTAAVEAITAYAAAHASGEESEILIAFLNATGAGLLTASQANDPNYLCNELSGDMATHVSSCAGKVTAHNIVARDSSDSGLEKRSR